MALQAILRSDDTSKLGKPGGALFWTADTQAGRIQGIAKGSIKQFKGVPYGAPTGGANRFMPPKPRNPWAGVRDCFGYGKISPQVPMDPTFEYAQLTYWDTYLGIGGMGEDCLNLNIWTPGVGDDVKRPVLVSLHGGGWLNGSGNSIIYDGSLLAEFGDIVVVTVNHRLAGFGYAHFAPLGAPPAFAEAGNCGALDMVAALKWIRDNITAFGGDPGNVTIFGQSGGGSKVSTLMAMPTATGLFHRAVVQSSWSAPRQLEPEQATANASRLLDELGLSIDRIDDIQALPWEHILEAQVRVGADFRPVVDGTVLPQHPFDPAAPEASKHIPLLISMTLHELSHISQNFDVDEEGLREVFRKWWGGRAEPLLDAYRYESPDEAPFLIQSKAATDAIRGVVMLQAERKAAQNGAKVWLYTWDWATDAFGGRYGAVHGADVEAAFRAYRSPMSGSGSGAGRMMTDRMATTLVAFASTGDPNNALVPQWPAYDACERATMVFDTEMRVVNDYRGNFVRMIGEVGPGIAS